MLEERQRRVGENVRVEKNETKRVAWLATRKQEVVRWGMKGEGGTEGGVELLIPSVLRQICGFFAFPAHAPAFS